MLLEVEALTRYYGQTVALDAVGLQASPGRIHGLLGPNGAGKTTLLSIVLGLVVADAGSIRLLGSAYRGGPLPDRVAGFVEAPRFYPYLTGRANLEVLARLDASPAAGRDELLAAALDAVGLSSRAAEKVRGYSLGMRQRLGVAACLLREPSLLILDEPSSGLDPAAAQELRQRLRGLAHQGAGVVLASHDLAEVEAVCDDVTVLRAGQVVFSGPLERLRALAPDPASALVTSDDRAALALARAAGFTVTPAADGALSVRAAVTEVDRLVIMLGAAGIAVRALNRSEARLEDLFFSLTGTGSPTGPGAADSAAPAARVAS